ncbi:hypothetical protein G6F70_005911 [Rhizopus microsporus]|uniref:Methyltransferase domain-containing protein n=2 Tax=Rhizopus TaxID=4842 RepID=A0A367J526_RHIAZ|nr:hypothetical protein G6F71_005857 [Rhizopus microsporus]RCH84949.1 hypothetical protein CU097_006218 [Rhizopus azygosporus]KAG1198301.1 hypothetical protein G6F70_005911 [Rhizopus microsporus]KAG1210020.1 hypothetical protein G6F69_005855 [Rhizopus microsporus]KAG1230213.1 hypothetical protein G6F67_006610 [Rhizopus microsporus]
MGGTVSKDEFGEQKHKRKLYSLKPQKSHKERSIASQHTIMSNATDENSSNYISRNSGSSGHVHNNNNSITIKVTPVKHQTVLSDHVSPISSLSNSAPIRRSSWRKSTVTTNDNLSAASLASCFDEDNNEVISSPRTSIASDDLLDDKRKKKKKLPGLASDIVLDSTRFTQNSLLDDKFWKTPIKSYVAYNKNDEKEYDRQLRQHYVLKHILHGNIHVPVSRDKSIIILDSACGAGFWTLDMALEYPNATIIGLDTFPDRSETISTLIGAPNVVYKYGDLTTRLQLPDNSIDVIFQRDTSTVLPHDCWPSLMSELKRIAKPGAYIEFMEYNFDVRNPGPVLELVNEWYKIASSSVGVHPSEVKRLKDFMIKAGFVDVQEKIIKIPIGEWPEDEAQRENGFLYKQVIKALFKSMKAWWVSELNVLENEYDKVTYAALNEFDEQKCSIEWVIYTARKPI